MEKVPKLRNNLLRKFKRKNNKCKCIWTKSKPFVRRNRELVRIISLEIDKYIKLLIGPCRTKMKTKRNGIVYIYLIDFCRKCWELKCKDKCKSFLLFRTPSRILRYRQGFLMLRALSISFWIRRNNMDSFWGKLLRIKRLFLSWEVWGIHFESNRNNFKLRNKHLILIENPKLIYKAIWKNLMKLLSKCKKHS